MKTRYKLSLGLVVVGLWLAPDPAVAQTNSLANSSSIWTRAPWSDPGFFPIAVWLQSPANAQRYKAAGINTYVGLWRGPTAAQLEQLRDAGMHVLCSQNRLALSNRNDPTIIGWMHGDEPDNAQSLGEGKGWGPPIPPENIVRDYLRIRAADPSRPVLLNLGQGVAWDGWYGRGVRSNHPEDYPKYVEGCDIASFDIYPAVHDKPEVAGKLWYVPFGVERLVRWTGGTKPVWNCLECTRISNPDRKPTPAEVRAEAWMAIIHGSQGLIYFVHQFKPVFREAALLDDADMLQAVTKLNREITQLAPVLKGAPSAPARAHLESSSTAVPIASLIKQHGNTTYIFAAAMREETTTATVKLADDTFSGQVEVIGEERKIPVAGGGFQDAFGPWGVHLYRLEAAQR